MRYKELLEKIERFFYIGRYGNIDYKAGADTTALAEYCLDLSKRTDDIKVFAKTLGIEVIPNSRFAKKYPPFALRQKRDEYKVSPPEESRLFYDPNQDIFYILIDDALSKGTQQEIIAYDIATLLLEYYTPWDKTIDERRKEDKDDFVAYLLGYMKEEDETETPDELVVEVREV